MRSIHSGRHDDTSVVRYARAASSLAANAKAQGSRCLTKWLRCAVAFEGEPRQEAATDLLEHRRSWNNSPSTSGLRASAPNNDRVDFDDFDRRDQGDGRCDVKRPCDHGHFIPIDRSTEPRCSLTANEIICNATNETRFR